MSTPPNNVAIDNQVLLYTESTRLKLIPGEKCIAFCTRVEDAKGHPGVTGLAQITNIRFIWHQQSQSIINCSIGFHTISSHIINRNSYSSLNKTETLFIKARYSGNTYEFIFSFPKSLNSSLNMFEAALANYESSFLFREQRLRTSIITNGALELLQGENVMLKIDGISNFSADVAKIGCATVTNLRFIWYSEIVTNFNVSLPLIILPQLKVKSSKRFGKCFFLKIYTCGQRYMYGFTMQPEEALVEFVKAAEKIRLSAIKSPVLTTEINADSSGNFKNAKKDKEEEETVSRNTQEESFVIEDVDKSLLYLSVDTGDESTVPEVDFDRHLGLSIEKLPEDVSLASKWVDASNTPLCAFDEL